MEPAASIEFQLAQCLRTLNAISVEHENVYQELAMAHPLYDSYLRESLGINVTGSGFDPTDRSVILQSLGGSSGAPLVDSTEGGGALSSHLSSQASMSARESFPYFGCVNWLEIGNESAPTVSWTRAGFRPKSHASG